MSDESIREAFLYIGLDLKSITPDNYPQFRSTDGIPISWFFLFEQNNIKTRQQVMPESISLFQGEFENDPNYEINFQEFMNEPVAFETTIPLAQERLHKFKEVFSKLPYFWSYFRVIEILEEQLEEQINIIAEKSIEEATPVMRSYHPDVAMSQVEIINESIEQDIPLDISLDELTSLSDFDSNDVKVEIDETESIVEDINPFAELMDFGGPAEAIEDLGITIDDNLMEDLLKATELDQDGEEKEIDIPDTERSLSIMYVTAKFDHLAIEGYGNKIYTIFERFDNLYHHAVREEGKTTRIMVDIFQDIFRGSLSQWRITGLLSEDFLQDASNLGAIMVGIPSAFNVKSNQTFDLEFWTRNTLQLGDERLMFTLSKLPSEDLHEMLSSGDYEGVAKIIDKVFLLTKAKQNPRFDFNKLSTKPRDSNIWGIRVIIPRGSSYSAATLLCNHPDVSWKEAFDARLDLPGVLNDWNVNYLVRFSDFSLSDNYQIVFKRAEDKEDTFKGFIRWIRRHNQMYRSMYGIDGTINLLKSKIIETEDQLEGQTIFTILTNLSQIGFTSALNALNDAKVVDKLGWIYSGF